METTPMTFFELCLTIVGLGIGWMIIMWLDKLHTPYSLLIFFYYLSKDLELCLILVIHALWG